MKRITAILLLTVAGLLAACTSPASSPGETTPLESFPAVSAEPSMDGSAEPSMDASASPTTVP